MDLTFREAVTEDAELLISIYNSAFYDDFIRYGECPAYGRSKERMESSIENYPKLVIMADGKPVGVVSYQGANGIYYIGCLCVIPEYQGRGIGSAAIDLMLKKCPDWREISLITPADKAENVRFYTEKCGFEATGSETDGNVEVLRLVRRRKPCEL